ncbi:MAG: hypothetical protein KBT48_09055 [Firmicutes bacterium]|nr:hypothetical protein [Bacillota bacterium]
MAIRARLVDEELDDLPQDVDDLDKAYFEKMKKEGIDEDLLSQFLDLTQSLNTEPEE